MKWLASLTCLLLFLSNVANATDGDRIFGCETTSVGVSSGFVIDKCYILCDTLTANGDCVDFDFNTSGIPDILEIQAVDTSGCDPTWVLTLTTLARSGVGDEAHSIGVTSQLDAMITRLVLDPAGEFVARFLDADLTLSGTCTDFDVLLIFKTRITP